VFSRNLSVLKKARLPLLAAGVSGAALLLGMRTHSAIGAVIAGGAALVAVGTSLPALIGWRGRNVALDHLREAIEPMAEGIAFFDADDRAVVWNSRYAELVDPAGMLKAGRSFLELLEANVAAGAHPESKGREQAWVADRMARRCRLGSDEHRNGDRWVRAERRRTRDGGLVTVCVDVTEFRRATEILAQARDAAEAANRAKSEFLANVSHELRTPLNGVLGIAEVLAQTSLDERQKEMVETIRASGATLTSLVSDIIELARLESGKIASTRAPFDLAKEVERACAPYRLQAKKKKLKFALEIAPEISGHVLGDAECLRQILSNLLSNAVKFTDAGKVTVTVERAADQGVVRFRVADTGIGFDSALKAHLFERFQQADGSPTRRHGGTGLGLAISKQAAHLTGGDLDCESTPGKGSVFVLTLDLPPAEAAASAPAGTADAEPAGHEPPDQSLRVLVVDDHPTNRRVVEMILDQVGAERVSVENGQEALEAYLNDRFDVVLMDIQMPVMDGLTATQKIRLIEKQAARSATPVIILSANAMPEHIEAGKAAGADRHLAKPISAVSLLSAIADVARSKAA